MLFDRSKLKTAFTDLPDNPKDYPDREMEREASGELSKAEKEFELKRMEK